LIRDDDGRLLLVRKRGTAMLMMPGGKLEPDEDARAALARELCEEIGCMPAEAAYVGRFRAAAANEPGRDVIADVYAVTIASNPSARSEIDEILWLGNDVPQSISVAPLVREHVLRMDR
jgi:8-oxo-dGTP diphosphatase